MNLIQYLLLPFGATKDCKTADNIFPGIVVSVLAIVWLTLAAPMIAFVHWTVTAFATLGLVFITMELRLLYQLKSNIKKIVEIFDNGLIKQRFYSIESDKVNFGLYISIVIFIFLLNLNFYISINSTLLDRTMHQGKYSKLYYFNCYIANFYALGLMNVSIYICFELRRNYFNIYIKRFLHDDLSKRKIIVHIFEFLHFYNNSRLDFLGYIEPIENSNMIILLLYNIYLVMCQISMYHYSESIIFVWFLMISLCVLDLYYLITHLIILNKTRVTKSSIQWLSKLKRERSILKKINVLNTIEEENEQEHIDNEHIN